MDMWQNPDMNMGGTGDWMKKLGMGAGLGQVAGGISSIFGGGGKNPANAAMKYLNQIPGQTQQYFQPYQQAGNNALSQLQGLYGQLTSNPGELLKMLSSGYKESPGYQRSLQAALGAGNNASAAGGMLGTPQHQEQNMEIASGVASKDYEDYLNHILGLFGSGVQGTQGLETQGYGANTDWASLLANLGQQQADLAYKGQAAQNQAKSGGLSDIFGGLATFLPFL